MDIGQRQKRSLKQDSLDRYRVTYEARQAVLNLCAKPDGPGARKPVEGIVLPGLLVVHGTHFTYNGRLVDRKAGASAGKLMTS